MSENTLDVGPAYVYHEAKAGFMVFMVERAVPWHSIYASMKISRRFGVWVRFSFASTIEFKAHMSLHGASIGVWPLSFGVWHPLGRLAGWLAGWAKKKCGPFG